MTAGSRPRRAVPFLNRTSARAEMHRQFELARAERRSCLLFVHGTEGMGRASLAGEFFYEHENAFDTWIEVDARQPNRVLTPMGEMLGQALRGLGMADTELPATDTARADAFQQLARGRRFLLALKDVASAEQVACLIPADAPEAAVVVTTGTVLRELLVRDFTEIHVPKLPRDDGRALLARRLGGTAGKIGTPTQHELADLCDGSPWLIVLLAAQLTGRPRATERFVADLRASGDALLNADQEHRIAGFLDLAYARLVRAEQTAYRTVALVPGDSFTVGTAAVAIGVTPARAEQLLDSLVEVNLVAYEDDSGRYSVNRIIQADGRRRAREVDGLEACKVIVRRVTGWLLTEAVPRDAGIARRWRVGPVFEQLRDQVVERDAALAWFAEEWRSLVQAVALAYEYTVHDVAWQLCVATFKYLHLHGHFDVWLDSHRLGVLSAQETGDLAGLMQVTSQRGSAYLALGELDRAEADFRSSLDAARRIGHTIGEQSALEWLGKVEHKRGRFDAACALYDESLALVLRALAGTEQGERASATIALQRGRALLGKRAWQDATDAVRDAERLFTALGERENTAKCLMVRGEAAQALADKETAAASFGEATRLFGLDKAWRAQADALTHNADVLAALGRIPDALDAYRAAQEILRRLGDPKADGVARRISELSA